MIFSSSLHKRSEWASVPNTLLSQQSPKWAESILDNHDIVFPLPNIHKPQQEFFRIILLSAQEFKASGDALQRIERLFHQHGGRHVGIIFLLTPNHFGTAAFMDLQLSLMAKTEMPILPLSNLTSLPTTISVFQRQLVHSARSSSSTPRVKPASALLPYCTTDAGLPEHARNIITDICPNLPALALAATTVDGRRALHDQLSEIYSAYTGESVTGGIIDFWEQELIAD